MTILSDISISLGHLERVDPRTVTSDDLLYRVLSTTGSTPRITDGDLPAAAPLALAKPRRRVTLAMKVLIGIGLASAIWILGIGIGLLAT